MFSDIFAGQRDQSKFLFRCYSDPNFRKQVSELLGEPLMTMDDWRSQIEVQLSALRTDVDSLRYSLMQHCKNGDTIIDDNHVGTSDDKPTDAPSSPP